MYSLRIPSSLYSRGGAERSLLLNYTTLGLKIWKVWVSFCILLHDQHNAGMNRTIVSFCFSLPLEGFPTIYHIIYYLTIGAIYSRISSHLLGDWNACGKVTTLHVFLHIVTCVYVSISECYHVRIS